MQGNDFYIILCFFLLAVLCILGAYGVIGYKIYLKNNAKQLNEMVEKVNAVNDDYKKLISQSLDALLCFTLEMKEFKKHPIYKTFKDDSRNDTTS